jgi:hypothetical protein
VGAPVTRLEHLDGSLNAAPDAVPSSNMEGKASPGGGGEPRETKTLISQEI